MGWMGWARYTVHDRPSHERRDPMICTLCESLKLAAKHRELLHLSSTLSFISATVVSRLRTRALKSVLDAFTTSIFLRLEFATPVMRSPSFSFTAA